MDLFLKLFDSKDFVPRTTRGGTTKGLVWLQDASKQMDYDRFLHLCQGLIKYCFELVILPDRGAYAEVSSWRA